MKEFAIGIDSGTTKTLVSYFNEETGKPKTVRLERETDSLPTPVYISKDKHQFFGEDDMPESVLLLGGTSQIPIIEARMKQASGLAYHRLQWRRKVATLLGVTLLSYGNGSQWAKADVMVLGEEGRQGLHTSHTSAKEDVNAREEGEQTVLMNVTWLRNATWWRRVKVFSKLVEHRIDVNARDNYGFTALTYAAFEGQVEAIEVLVRCGADVNAKANNGIMALMVAAAVGQTKSIEALVRCGANVNAKANNGITALMVAAFEGQAKSIEALVRCGADVNAKNEEGKTALTIAQDEGHSSIVSLLKRYGASSGIGCFITTAVCEHTGKPDDCAELTELRRFRDHWLARQEGGKELIDEYYRIAPVIVECLDRLANPGEAYRELLERYIEPCVALSKKGRCEECLELYKNMVETLSRRYLEPKCDGQQ